GRCAVRVAQGAGFAEDHPRDSCQGQRLFPDDTKTGETDALPAAFEKKADLMARFDKLGADAKAAEGAIKDEASFKAEWPKVVSNCGGCTKNTANPSSELIAAASVL